MKILISNDSPTAHYYIRRGWQNAFNYCGYECKIWNIGQEPAFDVFNKFEPDILISQVYNIDKALYKCIYNRPNLKVILKAPDFGPLTEKIKDSFPILYASQENIELIQELKKTTGKPDFLFVHYPQKYINDTHGYWGIKTVSLLNAADLVVFSSPQRDDRLDSDVSMCGGYWGYKSQTIDQYIIPLSQQNLNMKIFGNQPWPIPQYCGFLRDEHVKNLFVSTKINLNVHEPHSQKLGYDIVERPFKVTACGGFMISDYVEGLKELYPDMPMGKTPEEFSELINEYLYKPKERKDIAIECQKITLSNHTYFNRIKTILNELELSSIPVDNIISKLETI